MSGLMQTALLEGWVEAAWTLLVVPAVVWLVLGGVARVAGGAKSLAEAWRRLLGREGLVREGRIEGLAEGDRYRAVAATGDVLEGTVVVNDPPYEFAGTVAGWSDALLSLRTHDAAGPEQKDGHAAGAFVSTWGLPRADVDALGERWRRLLDELAESEG